jgi:hypothetical protein
MKSLGWGAPILLATSLFLALGPLAIASQKPSPENVLSRQYEYKMISSGRNYPSIRLDSDHLGDICILLHYGVPLDEIRTYFHWTPEELNHRVAALQGEDLIKPVASNSYRTTITVISQEEAQQEFAVPPSLIATTADAIESLTPSIRIQYAGLKAFQSIPFEQASFLILSDVLLDNWQIWNVEQSLFHAPRTPRAGKNYYYAAMQRSVDMESFGIYGNSYSGFGGIGICLYGNTRENLNLVAVPGAWLAEVFGPPSGGEETFRKELALELAHAGNRTGTIPRQHVRGFEMLGLVRDGSVQVPVLTTADDEALGAIAAIFTPRLIASLREHRAEIEEQYRRSRYRDEITFQEFFMWWYHFFYTAVTNELVARGLIQIPPGGTFTYLVM